MKKYLLMAVAMVCTLQASAQSTKIDDKEIVGTWIMESMQWEGEKKKMCGKESGYTQFKFYGADGEYACAELVLNKEGKVVFATTNYHVFRSGTYARKAKMRAVGIGSKTKWYFWPNASVREFISLLTEHRGKQLLIFTGLIVFYTVLTLLALVQ
jgi:hypothetical protein